MKKIITLLFFLSFTQMSMSQDLTKDFKLFAKKDLEILKTVVSVSIEQEQPILDFFYKKYKQYSIYSLTVDRKKEIALEYEQELKLLIYPTDCRNLKHHVIYCQENNQNVNCYLAQPYHYNDVFLQTHLQF